MTRYKQMLASFTKFDREHPEVWRLFSRYTFDRLRRGYKHYSADAVMHRVRWETGAGDPSKKDGFKINNNHVAFYARKFHEMFPQHVGFFRNRIQTARDRISFDGLAEI